MDMELWNTQITAWIGSVLWVPLHVAGMIAGMTAIMLVQSMRGQSRKIMLLQMTVAGMAFASALGLSSWVTLVFAVFWIAWIILIFTKNHERQLIIPMIYAGIIALILAAPFLAGILQNNGNGNSGQFPINFEVRIFSLVEPFVKTWPVFSRSLIMLSVLPINYLFELGFFLIVGILWLKKHNRLPSASTKFFQEELLLVIVVFLFGSFLRSSVLLNNDLGWRAWLPGQFILLIWGVDVIENVIFAPRPNNNSTHKLNAGKVLLITLAFLGILTSNAGHDLSQTCMAVKRKRETWAEYTLSPVGI